MDTPTAPSLINRWLTPDRTRPRPRRIVVAAIAEILSGAAMILWLADAFDLPFLAIWGVLILPSGIGLFLQIGMARASSVLFSVPASLAALLPIALWSGEPSEELIALGIVILTGPLVLYAVG